MKSILSILFLSLITTFAFSQAPESFKYQSVVRDGAGNVITNQNIGFQISILQTSSTGTAVYVEQHNVSTNNFGLANLNIGTGNVISGSFSTIDWGIDTYFIKIELDETGGTNYQLMGTSQLLSVPYALHAKTAENVTGVINYTETDPVFGSSVANGITAVDTANWNNHTVDTDTQIDSLGISNYGFVAGAHTIDTQIDSTGIAGLGYVAGAHTIDTDTQIDSTGIASFGFITTFNEVDGDSINELQTLSISNDTIFLSNGGFVKLGNMPIGGFSNTLMYNVTSNWVCPSGITKVWVKVWGAGGGGGGGTYGGPGGGGGGGAYGEAIISVTPGVTYNITVGVGGVGGANASGGNGGIGGTSDFGGLVIANGGNGGAAHWGSTNAGSGGGGGSSLASISFNGINGATSCNGSCSGGKGGIGGNSTFNLANGSIGQGGNGKPGNQNVTGVSGQNGLVIIYW